MPSIHPKSPLPLETILDEKIDLALKKRETSFRRKYFMTLGALASILLVTLLVLAQGQSSIPDPGHSANQIGPGAITGDVNFSGKILATTINVTGILISNNPLSNQSIQMFTSSGTWSRPAGVKKIFVEVYGGGGGGSTGCVGGGLNSGGGGGAGGVAQGWINVTGTSSVTVTIGAAGAIGGSGGTSIFGPLSAAGGGAGDGTSTLSGGSGGTGSGGDINLAGGPGGSGAGNQGGEGGAGGSNMRGVGGTGRNVGKTCGGGGGGCARFSVTEAAGGAGCVIVWEYR